MTSESKTWSLTFTPNVHMYCHELKAKYNNKEISIEYEDTPAGHMGIWVHKLDIPKNHIKSLIQSLQKHFETSDRKYRIYTTSTEYVTNESKECE